MIEEMELVVDLEAYWPEPPPEASQRGGEAVPHLCRLCLGQIESHAGDGVAATHWCTACGSAGINLAEVCFCGVSRAGARLKCVKLPGDTGEAGEVVVVEA